jgi:tetratricopeptide (TPR) repeat protein
VTADRVRRRMLWAVISALGLGAAFTSAAAAQDELFLEGNRLYQEGDFAAALDAYLAVEDSGFESGPLFYNLGNAYFKTGDLGRSILYYERAVRLLPGDEDAAENLALARSLTIDEVERLPRFWILQVWDWWVRLLPGTALAWLVAISYLIVGGALIAVVLGRSPPVCRISRRIAWVAGAIVVVFGLNLAVRDLGIGQAEEAVVMATELSAQSAPSGDPNLTVFSVHEGTKVRIDRRSEGWAEIVLEDGRVGWVSAEALETI